MSAVLHRSARADVRRTWQDLFWSPPASAPPARPSLLPVLHRSAGADVRRTWLDLFWSPPASAPPARPSLLPVLHRSAEQPRRSDAAIAGSPAFDSFLAETLCSSARFNGPGQCPATKETP